jgi:membrane-bound lytic murein transglycosylase D
LAEPAEPVVVARVPTAAELVSALTFEQPSEEPIHFLESFPKKIEGEDLATTEEVHDAEWEEPILADAPTPLLPNQLPDPSNYAVSDNDTIVVQADETLGHYADWLKIRTSQLRSLNRMRRNSTVVIGRRTKLDFSHASRETFERRRLEYHRTLQEEFFGSYTVTGTETHLLRRGDTMWYLAVQKYKLPVWLLRQYNPDLDFAALPAGSRLVIPNVEPRQS